MHIMLHMMEQGQKNQNQAAEQEIGILAKRWKLQMTRRMFLRDYGTLVSSTKVSYSDIWPEAQTRGLAMKKLLARHLISVNGSTLSSMI